MPRIEELNNVEYDALILIKNNIDKSGKFQLADRLNDWIIDNSLLIRDEIPGDDFRIRQKIEY